MTKLRNLFGQRSIVALLGAFLLTVCVGCGGDTETTTDDGADTTGTPAGSDTDAGSDTE